MEKNNKFLEFINLHSKKVIIGLISFVTLCLVAAGFTWWQFNGPIATVDGKKITRSDFNNEKDNFAKRALFTDDNSLNDTEKVKNYLIERKLLDVAAKELSITVSDSEVDADIDRNKDSFDGDVNLLKLSYEDAYGLTGDELEQTVYYKLLKDKILKRVVATKKGKYIYTRFRGAEEIAGVTTENLDTWAKSKIDGWVKQLESGKKFTDLYKEIVAENKYPAIFATEFMQGANSQYSEAEKEAINQLQLNQFGEITKLDGYYAVFYLEENNGGKFDSWDAFIKEYTDKYVKYPLISANNINLLSKKVNYVKNIVFDFFHIRSALAGNCSQCSGCDGYYIDGHVVDSVTGLAISGASLSGTSASQYFCNGSSSASITSRWCGYRTGTASSGADGYYKIPRQDGYSCNFNCDGGAVSLTAAKANYTSQVTTVDGTNGSGLYKGFNLVPDNRTIYVGVLPAGTGSVTGPGINCGTSGSDCNETWAFSTAATNLTPTPASGYAFDRWEWYPNYAEPHTDDYRNPLPVYHGGNYTIYAIFKASNFTITPSADAGCNINPSTAQIITAGGSSAFTGSSNTGYTYSGFSIDGGAVTAGSSYTFSNVTASHTIRAVCGQNHYNVTYNGNGSTGGTVPIDSTSYVYNGTVTVMGNTGNLVKTDSIFAGWNTQADGNGTNRTVDSTFAMGTSSITLYARWTAMNLSCSVTPDNGLSPLVVRIITTTNIPSPTLTYNYGDGTPTANRGATVYYTYETAGAYSVTVSEPRYRGGAAQSCSPTVINVANPDDGGGGEVRP